MWIIIVCIVIIGAMFYVGSDTAKEKEHDWLAVPIILIVFAAFTLAGLVGMCKSCSDSHPSYDYYEAPRK